MTDEVVTLCLPRALLSDAQKLATARNTTVGGLIRGYLNHETTKPPETKKEKAIRVLGPHFDAACGWPDLIARLAAEGYALKPQGVGLAIYTTSPDAFVCNTAGVAHKHRKLVKRFCACMPGHAHGDKWLPQNADTNTEFDVFE